jgi:betaine-aldehyde dehydrogenase
MSAWKAFPALAAGNTVVLKPPEQAPLAPLKLAELASELLPKGVFNVVLGPADTGKALVTHADVDMISLTGSSDVGRWVTEHAGLKRLSLGLGTTAPAIVFEDADVDAALNTISHTAFYNAGQDCATSARAIVAASIYDEAVDKFVRLAKDTVVGDPRSLDTQIGPLISESFRERVEGFLERCPPHAKIVAGGNRPDGPGFYLEPAVVTGLRQEDEMIQKEVYGPVMSIQPFNSDEEAIALANGTRYGLTGNIWTSDLQRALWCIRKLRLGSVNVNTTSHLATEKPFTAIKQSGYGSDVGMEAVEGYTQLKTVALNLLR